MTSAKRRAVVGAVLGMALAGVFGCDLAEEPEIVFRPGSEGDPDVWGVAAVDEVELWISRGLEERTILRVTVRLDDGVAPRTLDLGALELSSTEPTLVDVRPRMSRISDASVEVVLEDEPMPIVAPLTIDDG